MSAKNDFWSRRKVAVAAEAEAEIDSRQAEEAAVEREALEELSDQEVLAKLNLPDPDTMETGDDFSAFLKQAVPDRLRRRALRRLWLSNPTLANLDELVDYGEDYTDAATVVENLQTTYQVGKGMLKHLLATEASQEESAEVDAAALVAEVDEDIASERAPDEPPTELDSGTPVPEVTPLAEVEAASPAAPIRRRMRFGFAHDEQMRQVT